MTHFQLEFDKLALNTPTNTKHNRAGAIRRYLILCHSSMLLLLLWHLDCNSSIKENKTELNWQRSMEYFLRTWLWCSYMDINLC